MRLRAIDLTLKKRFTYLFYYKTILTLSRSIRDNDLVDKDFYLSTKFSNNKNEEEKKKSKKKSKINKNIVI